MNTCSKSVHEIAEFLKFLVSFIAFLFMLIYYIQVYIYFHTYCTCDLRNWCVSLSSSSFFLLFLYSLNFWPGVINTEVGDKHQELSIFYLIRFEGHLSPNQEQNVRITQFTRIIHLLIDSTYFVEGRKLYSCILCVFLYWPQKSAIVDTSTPV